MTRVSFSADTSTINVTLPKSWGELSQEELRIVLDTMDYYTDFDEYVPFRIFQRLAGMSVERRDRDRFLCAFKSGRKKFRCWLTVHSVLEHTQCLNFIFDPGNRPVRLDRLKSSRKYRAVNAALHNVSFRDYVKLENLYQGFLKTSDEKDVLKMAAILYPGFRPARDKIRSYEVLGIITWMIQTKAMFSQTFRNFFRPASGKSAPMSMIDVLNNEIRALTQGDVTKEDIILETDCWRALTELDFKAKEAEELNQIKNRKK